MTAVEYASVGSVVAVAAAAGMLAVTGALTFAFNTVAHAFPHS